MYLPLSAHISAEDPTSQLDVMWKTSLLLQSPRPSWSGTMQMLHRGEYPGESSVMFLPMIDLDPSDPSCIYTTMKFVSSHSAGSRLRGARGILLSAGPLRRGLATFATSTGAREPVGKKDKLSSQGLKDDGNFNRLIIFVNY